MALDSGNNNNYMILLGKRYPVIRCNMKTHHTPVTDTNEIGMEDLSSADTRSYEAPSAGSGQEEHSGVEEDESRRTVNEEDETSNGTDEQQLTTNAVQSTGDETVRQPETVAVNLEETQAIDGINEERIAIDDNIQPTELANVDEFVNLALTVGNGNSSQEFKYDITVPDEGAQLETPQTSESELSENQSETEHESDQQDVSQLQQEPQETDTTFNTADISQRDSIVADDYIATEHLPPDYEDTFSSADSLNSISGKLDILEYAKSEWKGTTYTAECLREGYQKMTQETGCRYMRQVRGDNYCALRATSFLIMSQNIQICQGKINWQEHVIKLPERLLKDRGCSWLSQWTFAQRLPSTSTNRISVMEECMSYFIEQKQLSDAMESNSNRQAHFSALFNSGSSAEVKIFEAIKLMMLETAVDLYNANLNGDDVPVFAWLLFARDSSENPKDLMLNHLNLVGNSGGLEQVEMCLLGHALEVTLRVFRPSSAEQEDFMTYYPDHMVETWNKVNLIAEDDRHYNIVVAL